MTTPSAVSDPRVGGRFDLVMKAAEDEMPHGGVYREINRPNRLVFSWESPFNAEGSTVTLDFRARNGGTHVTLNHVRFVNQESCDNHLSGWTAILAKLDDTLG